MIAINKKHLIAVATLLATVFLTCGCSVRVADLTLVSTKNIDLSNANFDVKRGQRAKGEDCVVLLLGIPLGVPNLEKAIDHALETGKGNVMVDQVTYGNVADFIIAGQSCIDVEGTVLNTGSTGRTPNKAVVKEPISYQEKTPAMNQAPAPYAPATQPVVENSDPNYENNQQVQPSHSGGVDLRHCLSLQSNEAIAKCVRGK